MFNLDSALGVDLREDKLVLASVSKRFQGYTLKSHLVLDGYRELSTAELSARIRQFATANGFSRENIVAGVPRDQVILRDIDMPIDVEENLDQVVTAQVERLEPSDDLRSYFDYAVVSRSEEARRISLQVVMVKRERVDGLLELLGGIDLYPTAIRARSAALASLVSIRDEGLAKNESALVLQLDADRVHILACSGDLQHVASEVYECPSGRELSAEWVWEKVGEMLTTQADQFPSFNAVFLAGPLASALHPEIQARVPEAKLLRQGLSLTHKIHDPAELEEVLPAIGLAVSGLQRKVRQHNLVPRERRSVVGRLSLIPTVVLAVLLVAVVIALALHPYYQQTVLAKQVESQVATLERDVSAVFALREEVAAKRLEVEELRGLLRGKSTTMAVLKDLTERIPDNAYLQSLQVQGDQVTLQGYSDQASELLPLIQASPFLEGVKTNWITKDPRMAGKDRFNFTAKVKTEQ